VILAIGSRSRVLAVALCLACGAGFAQQPDPPKQDIPDAPSASRPVPQFPEPPPTAKPEPPPPPNQAPPGEGNTGNVPAPQTDATTPPPPVNVKTAPPGTKEGGTPDDKTFTIVFPVNDVVVPVRVTDQAGHLVSGLFSRDFSVYENGQKQKVNFFTSDPFALSAAVIFDLGMPDVAVQKVNQTFPALEGAFSQFDEVSIYTYSSNVSRATDFTTVGKKLTEILDQLKAVRGRNNGPAVLGGPLAPQGPIVNGRPMDPNVPTVATPARESHVLNDAVLAAAIDLSRRDRFRRKIIFIISDGREYRSDASYSDVLKLLLSNGILVYGIGAEEAAIPGYSKLSKLRLPGLGYTNILPKYANATGGEIFTEFSRDAIESAYSRAIGDARNLYTVGYATRATPSSTYRQIEVRVARPDLKVYAKDGYYPAPAPPAPH
jgi:VWFA-related protein